jgi:hypothetical protein
MDDRSNDELRRIAKANPPTQEWFNGEEPYPFPTAGQQAIPPKNQTAIQKVPSVKCLVRLPAEPEVVVELSRVPSSGEYVRLRPDRMWQVGSVEHVPRGMLAYGQEVDAIVFFWPM